MFIYSCAARLSQKGKKIRVTNNADVIKDCRFLTQVEAESSFGGFGATSTGYKDGINKLRNKAAKLKFRKKSSNRTSRWFHANTILMVESSNTLGGTYMIGEAYYCEEKSRMKKMRKKR